MAPAICEKTNYKEIDNLTLSCNVFETNNISPNNTSLCLLSNDLTITSQRSTNIDMLHFNDKKDGLSLLAPPPDPPKTFRVNENDGLRFDSSPSDNSMNLLVQGNNVVLPDSAVLSRLIFIILKNYIYIYIFSDKIRHRYYSGVPSFYNRKSLPDLPQGKPCKSQKRDNYEKMSNDRNRERERRSLSRNNVESCLKRRNDFNENNAHRYNQSSSRNHYLDQISTSYISLQERQKLRTRGKRDNFSLSSSSSSQSDGSGLSDSFLSSETDHKHGYFLIFNKQLYLSTCFYLLRCIGFLIKYNAN